VPRWPMVVFIARRRRRPEPHLENFLESFASAARYVRYTPGMQVHPDAELCLQSFHCGDSRPGAGRGLAAFAAPGKPARAGVHQHGNRIAPGRRLDSSLRSRQSQPKHANDFGRRHAGRGSCLDVHRSKPLNVFARYRLGRHQLDGEGLRTLDRRTTGNARLGPRTDERC